MRSLTLLIALSFCGGLQAQVAVLNGASFRTDQPVTSGSWATAFGTFTDVTTATATEYPLPKSLGGVSVTVGGLEAPVYYVSATQINFLVPYQTAPGQQEIQVRTTTGPVTGNFRVISAAPGIFVKDVSGAQPPKGAILNQDGTENTQASPVQRGQAISIYATGPGVLRTSVGDGTKAPSDPLVWTVSTPDVYIGGIPATVQYSGLAPDFAGLWQINAIVPSESFVTGKVPVQLFMDGVDSNEVTIFVAQ